MEFSALATWLVDGVIAVTLCEGLLLAWWFRRTGSGVPPSEFVANMASGLCLMLALRGVLTHGPGVTLMLWLLLAGLAHGADVWRRWRRGENAA